MKFKNLLKTRPRLTTRQLCLSAVCLFGLSAAYAQTTVTVGTGTGSTPNAPTYGYYNYSYSQTIYTASDISTSGGGMGTITKIRYYHKNGNLNNTTNWTIYLGHVAQNNFASQSDWVSLANMTQVFTGTVTSPGNDAWMEITLDTPFPYNGTDNLVIAVDENQSGYTSSYSYWNTTSASNTRTIYYYSDSNNPDPANPPSGSGSLNSFVNVQFEITPQDCSGAPAASVVSVTPNDTLCEGIPFELSIPNQFFGGIEYQWQEFDGTSWNDIPDDTSFVHTADNGLTSDMSYRVIVSCANSAMQTISDTMDMVINPNPTVTVDLPESAICSGEVATITASGADTYSWSPGTALDNTNTATVNANPTSPTTYTVTGTDANGCVNTATAKVTPNEDATANMTISPNELCTPGTPVAVTIDGLPMNASGGTWNYRFLGPDGITVEQNWNSNNVFNYVPAEDSLYQFFYQVRNTACPGEVLDSVPFSFAVGFGADVTTIDYDCINQGGTISLSDVFGQADVQPVYSNDFTATADLSALTFSGVAAVNNDRAVLTPSQTSATGYMMLTLPGLALGSSNAFDMTFDMTADMPIDNYGTGGADGLAFSFGDNANPTANGNGPNGKGTKLRLSFDAAGNSSENGNQSGIYLVYGWTAGNAYGPGSAQTLAYSSNTSLWKGKTDIPVHFWIDGSGKAYLTVDGTAVFSDVQLPAAYTTADVSNWTGLFSAGTGGDAERHAITNLDITAPTMLFGLSTGAATDVPTSWQNSTLFDSLAPGTYHVWVSKDTDAICGKNVETVEIINTNPVVDLGNDTTICEGSTLTLDAGNAGATYTWSNTNDATQMIDVMEAGSYVAYVTAPNGCLGIGTINVDVLEAPDADGIYMQGAYPNMQFTVLNATSTTGYDWDFGDGTTITNAPASVEHTYWAEGMYDVTVTLSNDCGTADITQQFDVHSTLSVDETSLEGLSVYPNPTTGKFGIRLDDQSESVINVYSMTGSLVMSSTSFNGSTVVDATDWEKGVYFVKITNRGMTSTVKVVIQ